MKSIFLIFTFRWVFTLQFIWVGVLIVACPYSLLACVKEEILITMSYNRNLNDFITVFTENPINPDTLLPLLKDSFPVIAINERLEVLNSIFSNMSLLDLIRSEGLINTIKLLFWGINEAKQLNINQWIVLNNMHDTLLLDADWIQARINRLTHAQNTFSWIRDNPVYSYILNSLHDSSRLKYLAYFSIFGSALIAFVSLGVSPNLADIIYI